MGADLAKVNKAQLAELLGFTERSLTEWQSEGMPIEHAGERGQENVYDTQRVVAWMLQRAENKVRGQSARDDLLRSQKRLTDIQIAEKERTLVNAGEVEAGFARLVVAARTELLRLPDRLVEDLKAAPEDGLRRAVIDKAIRESLEGLACAQWPQAA